MLITQLIISFVVGGLTLSLQTLIGERVPEQWRGAVLAFPSTIALGFLFIGLTKSPDDIPAVATAFTAAVFPSVLFVVSFTLLVRWRLWVTLLGAYSVWGFAAYAILRFPVQHFYSALGIYALPAMLVGFYILNKLPQVKTLIPVPMTWQRISIRSILAGALIVIIILLAKTLGNNWGGLFSCFPAAFSFTLIIYSIVHGKAIIPAVAKSLFFPGIVGLILYAWVASLTFPHWGIWNGTIVSYLAVVFFYLCLHGYRKFTHTRAEAYYEK